ncbi:type IV toxin-antitoxin system AbiEi family antitoxin [Cellulomonas sp. SLBN-39]|uniref:type IV toxin-antitoxin system AbiEi family antitoxin n=1 Tax=Cellulomonas sp. SLBN-39 TaxID=2768446 RepID=UPI001359F078|nr:type IV toxin-antitoxin system AbiEi family antitoxin [Cellulomonas sp. SLBN-39]
MRRTLPLLGDVPAGDVAVLVARRASPGARTLLDEHRLSWVDEAGNARVAAGPLTVAVDAPPPVGRSAPEGVRWTDASGAVAELVLGDAVRIGTDSPVDAGSSLARRIGTTPPVVTRALQGFDAEGWCRRSGAARGPGAVRHITDPGAMLSAWAAWCTTRRRTSTLAHTLMPDVDAWIQGLEAQWPAGRWAVTGEAAAAHRAPFLSRVTIVDIYLAPDAYDEHLDDLLDAARLRPVDAGGRVRVLRADPYVLRLVDRDGSAPPLVPDVRVYADLLRTGVRGEEAATELRDRRIGF